MKTLKSSIRPGDRVTAPLRVVLHRSMSKGEWVTHQENMQTTEKFTGHYFPAIEDKGGETGAYIRAMRDYSRRCAELGVDPLPEHTDEAVAIPITVKRFTGQSTMTLRLRINP